MTTIKELRELEKKATKGPWYALWQDASDLPARNQKAAFEFVGIPTGGSILTGCKADIVVGVEVPKGTVAQVAAHANIRLVEAARNALPALLDIAEKASEAVEAGAVDEIYLTLLRDALARLAEAK